ncbi:hypothetical protein, partial [Varibaculum sp.]|uniref:2-oxoglutarate dehydrogenase E1 subunit family protein n=1 Tax=Varibaculum sp. TaxID=1895474 RepID=UPI0025F4FB83
MPISEEQIDQSVSPINQEIIDDLYDKYCADPMNLPEDWRNYFSALEAQQAQIKQVTPQEPTSPKNAISQISVTGRDVTRSDLPPAPPVAASEPTSPYVARETALNFGPGEAGKAEDEV